MKRVAVIAAFALATVLPSRGVAADEPRADASLRVGLTDYHDLDATDLSFGVGFSYRLTSWLAAEAQLALAPSDLGDARGFSDSRLEGSLGFRVGPDLERTGAYAAVRPGFVQFSEPDEPIICIAIFPPPLRCTMATGPSIFALDLAGGLQVSTDRGVVRLEVGDRMVKYPGPTLGADFEAHEDGYWSHNLAASFAVGVRF